MLTEKHLAARRAALQNPHTFTLVLLALTHRSLGQEALTDWLPETVFRELEDMYGVQLPVINQQKLTTGLDIFRTDAFYNRLPLFVQHCNVLSSVEVTDVLDIADPGEIFWGVAEAHLIFELDPPDGDVPVFSPEIVGYIEHTLASEGLTHVPSLLRKRLPIVLPAASLQATGLEDPELLQAAVERRQELAAAAEADLQADLHAMAAQLAALNVLEGRKTADIAKQLVHEIQK